MNWLSIKRKVSMTVSAVLLTLGMTACSTSGGGVDLNLDTEKGKVDYVDLKCSGFEYIFVEWEVFLPPELADAIESHNEFMASIPCPLPEEWKKDE
jgi:hypothetical protein